MLVIASHLLNIRAKAPLTETSAFKYESFYGEMRRCFAAGTKAPLKQIMQKIYLKRALTFHCCENSLFFCPKDTMLECNSLIYKFADGVHSIYEIIKIDEMDDNIFHCHVHGKFPVQFKEAQEFPWDKVGVFRRGGILEDIVQVTRDSIAGKVLQVSSLLITCPKNVLNEK